MPTHSFDLVYHPVEVARRAAQGMGCGMGISPLGWPWPQMLVKGDKERELRKFGSYSSFFMER
jgi:hypothetical protein